MAEHNCGNCARKDCAFMPPPSGVHCGYWKSDTPVVNHWISCLKSLPEPLQSVIVCTDIRTVTLAWLNGDHWVFADTGGGHTENWSFDAVKYWMYLPEPPEGEQK